MRESVEGTVLIIRDVDHNPVGRELVLEKPGWDLRGWIWNELNGLPEGAVVRFTIEVAS